MESSQWENCNRLFYRNVSFLTDTHYQFRGVGLGTVKVLLFVGTNIRGFYKTQ